MSYQQLGKMHKTINGNKRALHINEFAAKYFVSIAKYFKVRN